MSEPCRVLVIEDSAGSRRQLVELLEAEGDIIVEGRAADGREGLQALLRLRPDVVTVDLELPGLDGFSLLRLVMAQAPTPVVVISSYAHPSDTFRALELGAVDFIPKRQATDAASVACYGHELREKIRAAKRSRPRAASRTFAVPDGPPRLIAIGASTGGPPAIQALLEGLGAVVGPAARAGPPVVICQHMPEQFTRAFAERLSRHCGLPVEEADHGVRLRPGHAYVARGGVHLEVESKAGQLVLAVRPRAPGERHAPSVDRLFRSVAGAVGRGALGLVLTGMGDDGALGAKAIASAGGEVWAESEASSVIFGMPAAAIETGSVARVLHLEELVLAVQQFARVKAG